MPVVVSVSCVSFTDIGMLPVFVTVTVLDPVSPGFTLVALNTEAATLKALGNTESHDVRRSEALGRIARRQTQLDLKTVSKRA